MIRSRALAVFKGLAYTGIYGGLLMPLMFIPVVIFPFVFSKLIFFQILIGLTFPAYLVLAWMEPKFRPPKSALYGAILAYFVALLLSVAFSVDPLRSWWGNQERMNGLFTLLHFLAWLTMAIGMLKTWTDWKRILNYEVALSVFMAIVALLQLVKKDLLLFPAGDRVGGLLDNPIYMGAYQIFNLAFIALLFMKTKSVQLRIWYVIAALFDLAAFTATQSRGALVGLAAFVGSFAAYYAVFTTNRKLKWGVLAGAGTAFAAYGLALVFRTSDVIQSIPVLSRLTNLNVTSATRLIAWDIAWKGFLERPLTGWGLDAFHVLFNLKYNPRSLEFGLYETWFDRAHNTVMDVLAMTGVFGFLTFFGIFIVLFVSVWRAQKRGWIDLPIAAILMALPIGYFLQNLFVFDHPAAFSMSYLLFALVIAATRPTFMGKAEDSQRADAARLDHPAVPRAAPWIVFAVIQVLCLFVVWRFSVLPFQASLLTIRSNQLAGARPAESWALMQQAGSIPTPFLDEQTFLLSRNLVVYATNGQLTNLPEWRTIYEHAKRLSEKHILEHPRNTHLHFTYARLIQEVAPYLPKEEQAAEIALAEKAYRSAIETSPKRQQLYYGLARLYLMAGVGEAAQSTLQTALDFNRDIGESWWYLGLASWKELGQTEEGTEAVLQAVKVRIPYRPQQVRDALYLAEAAAIQNDQQVLRDLLPTLRNLPGGTVDLFLDIARAYERAGLIEERNILLNAIGQADPSVEPKLEALRNGSATSIDASFKAAGE